MDTCCSSFSWAFNHKSWLTQQMILCDNAVHYFNGWLYKLDVNNLMKKIRKLLYTYVETINYRRGAQPMRIGTFDPADSSPLYMLIVVHMQCK